MSNVYQKYCNYLNNCVNQLMTSNQKSDYYNIKKQVLSSVVESCNAKKTDWWCFTDYHTNMSCKKIKDIDDFDGSGQLLVITDEYFCFHDQGLRTLESIVEFISKKNFQYVITSLIDYKNQPSYLKDFSLPNKVNSTWFMEREISRKENYSDWVIETNHDQSIEFDKSQVFFKQLASCFMLQGYKISIPNNVAYKSLVRRNFESLLFIEKMS